MAVTLSVELTDNEQAKLVEVAALVAPGATPLQIKKWAEKTAKAALRQQVLDLARQARSEAEYAARKSAEQADTSGWPVPEEPVEEPV